VTDRGKKAAFWAVTLAFPFLVLAILEGLFRLTGWFAEEPFIVPVSKGGKEFLQFNPWVAKRYFDPNRVSVPAVSPETFARVKPAHSFRIFCLGESTTAGFPFDCHVQFPRQLRAILEQAYPDRKVEVINAGISAVNSYTVLDLLPDILKTKPDLVIVYLGHNEFYGAYGSASAISIGRSDALVRFFLKLQKIHVVQMMRRGVQALGRVFASPPSGKTLMGEVVRDQQIPYGSEQYQQTLAAFRTNLGILCGTCREEGVPVFLSTLVSNIRDLPPFMSATSARAAAWLRAMDSLRTLGKNDECLLAGRKAFESDSGSAEALFAFGREQASRGDSLIAAEILFAAKDKDLMRFRASEDVNTIICETARTYNVRVVDILQWFRDRAPLGIPGNEWLCDHLHPTPDGYYEMARAYFEAIALSGLAGPPDSSFHPQEKPYFVTDLDWDIGLLKVYGLMRRWPFKESLLAGREYVPHGDPAATKIAQDYLTVGKVWSRAQYAMADEYIRRKDYASARKQYRAVAMFAPDDPFPYQQVARTYELEQDWENREIALQSALERSSSKGLILYHLAMSQWKQGRLDKACATMEAATVRPELSLEERQNARFYLAGFFNDNGQKEKAKGVLRLILTENPGFAPAKQFLFSLERSGKP